MLRGLNKDLQSGVVQGDFEVCIGVKSLQGGGICSCSSGLFSLTVPYEDGNNPSGSMRGGKYLSRISHCQRLGNPT